MIPKSEWKWYGNPGHFICSAYCRFHLCTEIGDYLVSTVGEYIPDSKVREILAETRGITLEGKGDAREYDYMKKIGFEEIGYGRTYETMAFKISGKRCDSKKCGCGLPEIIPSELKSGSYNTGKEATEGHNRICEEVAAGNISSGDDNE